MRAFILPTGTALAAAVLVASMAGCRSCGSGGEPREREPLSLIPSDVIVVGSVEMGPVRSSVAYKRLVKRESPLRPYLGDCDYDPLPVVDRIWFGAGADANKGRGGAVVMGELDRDRLLECIRTELREDGLALEESDVQGFTTYAAGPGRPHLAWLDRATLVVGDRSNVEKILALEKGQGKSVRTNTTLLKLWERAADGRDIAVAATPDAATMKQLGSWVPDDWSLVLGLEQMALGARFMKGLDLMLTVRHSTGSEATKLKEKLERSLDRYKNHDYVAIAGLSSHLKAIRIEGAGPEITARADWTERQVDTLARLAVDSVEEIMRGGPDGAAEQIKAKIKTAPRLPPSKGDGGAATPDAGARAKAADGAPASRSD